jgi:hypothetical protein
MGHRAATPEYTTKARAAILWHEYITLQIFWNQQRGDLNYAFDTLHALTSLYYTFNL